MDDDVFPSFQPSLFDIRDPGYAPKHKKVEKLSRQNSNALWNFLLISKM